jgi:Trk K+ transport system NAD-binding subunit
VDFDPETVRRHTHDGSAARYGDAEDPEFVAALPLDQMRWVVSTVRDRAINAMLLHSLRQQGYKGRIAVAASNHHDADLFREQGVDLVLIPYADAAREAAERLLGKQPDLTAITTGEMK